MHETKGRYKARLKKHMKSLRLRELKTQEEQHKKISEICYDDLKIQAYLETNLLNNHEALLLFSLRSQNAKLFLANFPYNSNQICPNEGCNQRDTQEHCLNCEKMLGTNPASIDIRLYCNICKWKYINT